MDGNGTNPVEGKHVDTIILAYDREADKLSVGGKANSLDLMLDMLGRAIRAVEYQVKEQHALQLQKALQEDAENRRIAAALRGGR